MKSFLTALQSRFTSAGLATTITGGLHLNLVPPNTSMPYAVVRAPISPTTQTYGSSGGFSEPYVDFIVVGKGPADTLTLAESLRDAYKNQILSVSGGTMINCIQSSDPIPSPEFPETDEQADDAFAFVVSFRYSVNG